MVNWVDFKLRQNWFVFFYLKMPTTKLVQLLKSSIFGIIRNFQDGITFFFML